MRDPATTNSSTQRDPTRTLGPDPTLVVVSSGELFGRTLVLDGPERTVGRADGSDLRLDDPYTSRLHALLRRAGTAVLVEDAGSTAGVNVNGQRIDGPTILRPGDIIRVGRIDLQFRPEAAVAAQPRPLGAGTAGHEPAGGGAQFDVGAQRAGVISNVGRDQISYNEYALKFAPLRRRARTLIQTGVALVLGGFGLSLLGLIRYMSVFQEWTDVVLSPDEVSPEQAGEVFSRLVSSAFPFFIAGAAMTLGGLACIVIGLLMRRHAREATR